jgi:peptidyl-prolyl cis-trans isomerase SurA
MSRTSFAQRAARFAVLLAAALCLGSLASTPSHAQAVVASVNDDPVTNVDIEQHMKILRVLQKNATRESALESIYETRLKLMEMSKYKVNPGDQDIGWALGTTARRLKTDLQSLLGALQRAGVTEDQWKQKWKAEAGWMQLIRALNRTLEVSETEVRAELEKSGQNKAAEYTVRQIILVVPNGGNPEGRLAEATQLRARFTDCAAGIPMAAAFRDTAVKEPITRSASTLNDGLRKILDSTPVGRLTPPSRSPQGIEMLAVCNKSDRQDAAAAETVRNDMLFKKLQGESDKRYAEVRSKAIIVKR